MDSTALIGQTILVLEDEPLIALEFCEGLKGAGASVIMAHCLRDALALTHHPDLSAAILDFGLDDGDAGPMINMLRAVTSPLDRLIPPGSPPEKPPA